MDRRYALLAVIVVAVTAAWFVSTSPATAAGNPPSAAGIHLVFDAPTLNGSLE